MLKVEELKVSQKYTDKIIGQVKVLEVNVEKDEIRLEILDKEMADRFVESKDGGFKFSLKETIEDFTLCTE